MRNCEWQNIETAPKDGTLVMVANQDKVALAHRLTTDLVWYQYVNGTPMLFHPVLAFEPTHWMPLHPAPDAAPAASSPEAADERAAVNLHATMDASVWAKEFCRLFPGSDEGLMLSWFANAIMVGHDHAARAALASAPAGAGEGAPIDMLLYCPNCGMQHVDAPEPGKLISAGPNAGRVRPGWDNPPHKSHLCHGCGCIWRPADVPTNGVAELKTKGKADTWPAPHNEEVRAALAGEPAVAAADEGRDHIETLAVMSQQAAAAARSKTSKAEWLGAQDEQQEKRHE